jgi:hypothetical protein
LVCIFLHHAPQLTAPRSVIRAAVDHPQELLYNKDKLLANGDKWEAALSKNIEAEFMYR